MAPDTAGNQEMGCLYFLYASVLKCDGQSRRKRKTCGMGLMAKSQGGTFLSFSRSQIAQIWYWQAALLLAVSLLASACAPIRKIEPPVAPESRSSAPCHEPTCKRTHYLGMVIEARLVGDALHDIIGHSGGRMSARFQFPEICYAWYSAHNGTLFDRICIPSCPPAGEELVVGDGRSQRVVGRLNSCGMAQFSINGLPGELAELARFDLKPRNPACVTSLHQVWLPRDSSVGQYPGITSSHYYCALGAAVRTSPHTCREVSKTISASRNQPRRTAPTVVRRYPAPSRSFGNPMDSLLPIRRVAPPHNIPPTFRQSGLTIGPRIIESVDCEALERMHCRLRGFETYRPFSLRDIEGQHYCHVN